MLLTSPSCRTLKLRVLGSLILYNFGSCESSVTDLHTRQAMPPVTLDHHRHRCRHRHHCSKHEAERAGSPLKNDRHAASGVTKHVIAASDRYNLQVGGLHGFEQPLSTCSNVNSQLCTVFPSPSYVHTQYKNNAELNSLFLNHENMLLLLCATNRTLMSHICEHKRPALQGVFIAIPASICVHTTKTRCLLNTGVFIKEIFDTGFIFLYKD